MKREIPVAWLGGMARRIPGVFCFTAKVDPDGFQAAVAHPICLFSIFHW